MIRYIRTDTETSRAPYAVKFTDPPTQDRSMSLLIVARVAAAVVVTAGIGGYVAADLKGDYNVKFVVQETPYTGTFKTTPGEKSAFTAKLDFTTPSRVLADATGKTAGDSITFDAKYEDQGRGCTGTLSGKGKVEKDATKSAGVIDIIDSCGGVMSGTFRLWK
jgi:hypothetical protein